MLFPSTHVILALFLPTCIFADIEVVHTASVSRAIILAEKGLFSTLGVSSTCLTCSISTTLSSPTTLSTQASSATTTVSSSATSTTIVPSSSPSSVAASSQSSSLIPTQSAWTSIQTDPAMYDMAITTTYTQSAQCTNGAITQMAWRGTTLWENDIHPVATSTITTCFPPQFYSSVMGAINSVVLPAFSALVCPYNWETINYNETYIACCPNNFQLYPPYYADNTGRPFSGAACTSTLYPDELLDITSYDTTAYWTVVPTTVGDSGSVVFANAFDGIMATATAATTTSSSSTITTTTTSTSATTSCTPAATVSVNFRIPFNVTDTAAGENVNLIGSEESLGDWVIADSIRMSDDLYTVADPLWETTVAFPAGTYIEYKYLHILANGSIVWSDNPNYSLTVPTGCATTESIDDVWR